MSLISQKKKQKKQRQQRQQGAQRQRSSHSHNTEAPARPGTMAATVDASTLKGLQEGGVTPHAVAEQIALAMRENGGMMEVQHLGVDPATIREAFESTKDLFALSEARKRDLPVWFDQPMDARTGYRAAFTESLGPRTKNDARESFTIHVKGREAGTNAVRFRGDVSGTPPRFQAAAEQLLAETLDAAERLLEATSAAMGLAGPEKDFFEGIFDKHDNAYIAMNYFPALAPGEEVREEAAAGTGRAGTRAPAVADVQPTDH